jgi:hypothetical protein
MALFAQSTSITFAEVALKATASLGKAAFATNANAPMDVRHLAPAALRVLITNVYHVNVATI